MKTEIQIGGRKVAIEENVVDRVIRYFDPIRGQSRFHARVTAAISGSYVGASRTKRSLSEWFTRGTDADASTIVDLPTLRNRSRDMVRNSPLATGAINTVCTNTIGVGLKLHPRIDRETLGMSEEEASAWESAVSKEWALFAESTECDAARTLNFTDIQDLVFRATLESGDVFVLLRFFSRQGSPYNLKLQTIEADRICNANDGPNTSSIIAGIDKDKNGAPVNYHILNQHPGYYLRDSKREWQIVPVFGKQSGRRNVLHLYQMLRPGQTRGVPYLAPVIDALKQVDRYTEAELMAAVISGMFTVFITSETGDGMAPMTPAAETNAKTTDDDYKLAPGAIVNLARGEGITSVDPKRPNTAFDPFVMAILRQVGAAIEIPFELLVKHFTSSYSAARAALLEAWKFFNTQRQWLAANFCQPVYEAWMDEAVATGRIDAPGYFDDRSIRKAYLGAEWIGPAKGMIDERSEIEAAQMRADMGVTTLAEETAALTGGNWEQKHPQSAKEYRMRKEAGLLPADKQPPQKIQVTTQPN